jgi:hypothetical protein
MREEMKRSNCNYGNKLEQRNDEAFNAGKEIEVMKRLTLHHIASSLHRCYASVAQLCSLVLEKYHRVDHKNVHISNFHEDQT